jgi:hypothetical protein
LLQVWPPSDRPDHRIPLSKQGASVDPSDFKSVEAEKLAVNANYRPRFDPGLILLVIIVVCTAYFLAKLD